MEFKWILPSALAYGRLTCKHFEKQPRHILLLFIKHLATARHLDIVSHLIILIPRS